MEPNRRSGSRAGAVLALMALAAAAAACGPAENRTVAGGERSTPSLEQIAATSYRGIHDDPVPLVEGRYEGEPFVAGGASRPTVRWIEDLVAFGDLDGDAVEEAAVLLAESSGGSGTRIYLAVVGVRDGQPVNLATAGLGDRTQIRSMRVDAGRIGLDVVRHGAEDAACCPTELAAVGWALLGEALEVVSEEVAGTLSTATLAPWEWVLTALDRDEPAPAEPEITATFEVGRITGSSGCNRYFAAFEEGSPGSVEVGSVGATRMACAPEIMELESLYLRRLGNVNRYGFLAGRLALCWQDENGSGTLLFSPRGTVETAGAPGLDEGSTPEPSPLRVVEPERAADRSHRPVFGQQAEVTDTGQLHGA